MKIKKYIALLLLTHASFSQDPNPTPIDSSIGLVGCACEDNKGEIKVVNWSGTGFITNMTTSRNNNNISIQVVTSARVLEDAYRGTYCPMFSKRKIFFISKARYNSPIPGLNNTSALRNVNTFAIAKDDAEVYVIDNNGQARNNNNLDHYSTQRDDDITHQSLDPNYKITPLFSQNSGQDAVKITMNGTRNLHGYSDFQSWPRNTNNQNVHSKTNILANQEYKHSCFTGFPDTLNTVHGPYLSLVKICRPGQYDALDHIFHVGLEKRSIQNMTGYYKAYNIGNMHNLNLRNMGGMSGSPYFLADVQNNTIVTFDPVFAIMSDIAWKRFFGIAQIVPQLTVSKINQIVSYDFTRIYDPL